MNWLLPIIFGFSFSVRTPNIEPNPYDYEYHFSVEKPEVFYIEREWERELGSYYIDQEYWTKTKFDVFELKETYIEKTSKDVEYNQLDVRYKHKLLTGGYAIVHVAGEKPTHNLVIGLHNSYNLNILVAKVKFLTNTDLVSNFNLYSIKTKNEIKIGLLQNLNISGIYQYEKPQIGQEDYQAKIKLEIEFPTIKEKEKEK